MITDIGSQWLQIVFEGVSWIKEQLGPSKKDLKIQVAQLEEQVKILMKENAMLTANLGQIVQAILQQLQSEGNYYVKANTIICLDAPFAPVQIRPLDTNQSLPANTIVATSECGFDVSQIFDGIDEEIIYTKAERPSERG